jgi:hypothetical protein
MLNDKMDERVDVELCEKSLLHLDIYSVDWIGKNEQSPFHYFAVLVSKCRFRIPKKKKGRYI